MIRTRQPEVAKYLVFHNAIPQADQLKQGMLGRQGEKRHRFIFALFEEFAHHRQRLLRVTDGFEALQVVFFIFRRLVRARSRSACRFHRTIHRRTFPRRISGDRSGGRLSR